MAKVRLFQKWDAPALVAINARKSEQLGEHLWLPKLDEERTKVVLVLEDEGVVKAGLVFRDVTEMILVGDQSLAIKGLMRKEAAIRAVLDRAGINEMIAPIPRQLLRSDRESGMERIMKRLRFRNIDSDVALFEGEIHGQV